MMAKKLSVQPALTTVWGRPGESPQFVLLPAGAGSLAGWTIGIKIQGGLHHDRNTRRDGAGDKDSPGDATPQQVRENFGGCNERRKRGDRGRGRSERGEGDIMNPKDHARKLTTTLNRLKKAGACLERYQHLVKSLGGVSFGRNVPINLLTILEINGIDDCLWALGATTKNSNKIARLIAADCAESVLYLFEGPYPTDKGPRMAIEAARQYALGEIGPAAAAAAGSVAWLAARWVAGSAASPAALAAWAAAESPARWGGRSAGLAAWDSARLAAAAAGSAILPEQAKIIKRYLLA